MENTLDSQQELLVKHAIRELVRVRADAPELYKEVAGDLVWDLTCLISEDARQNDARSYDEVLDGLKQHGRAQLDGLLGAVEKSSAKVAVAGVIGMLNVAGITKDAEVGRWQERFQTEPELHAEAARGR